MQYSYAKIGENPDPKIWESTSRKRKRPDNKKPTATEKSLQYYKVIECSDNKLMCKCLLCDDRSKAINATKSTNLASHLKNIHPTIFQEKIIGKIKEPLPMKRLRILQNAVEIVAVNGRTFSALCDSGYQSRHKK